MLRGVMTCVRSSTGNETVRRPLAMPIPDAPPNGDADADAAERVEPMPRRRATPVEEESGAELHSSLEMLIGLILDRLDSDQNGKVDKKELDERRRQRTKRRDDFLRMRDISFEKRAAQKGKPVDK